jgi:hypothetical protein
MKRRIDVPTDSGRTIRSEDGNEWTRARSFSVGRSTYEHQDYYGLLFFQKDLLEGSRRLAAVTRRCLVRRAGYHLLWKRFCNT